MYCAPLLKGAVIQRRNEMTTKNPEKLTCLSWIFRYRSRWQKIWSKNLSRTSCFPFLETESLVSRPLLGEDLEFYRWLNEKCAGKCWTAEFELKRKKALCRFKYKRHVEASKDRVYFKPDTYNPCPELYTLPELNAWLRGE